MSHRYNRGIVSFCQQKSVDLREAVKQFTEYCDYRGKEKDQFIQENWNKFATFVDKQIKAGKLKGEAISLNGGYYKEQARKNNAYKEEMASFTEEERQFWNKVKEESPYFSDLAAYFSMKGLYYPKQANSMTRLGKILPRYETLKENNLLEDFYEYKDKKA